MLEKVQRINGAIPLPASSLQPRIAILKTACGAERRLEIPRLPTTQIQTTAQIDGRVFWRNFKLHGISDKGLLEFREAE